jgi:hypothetical protein
MTPQELKQLIQSDTEATQLISQGSDWACAERCVEIAPLTRKPLPLSEMGVMSLYAEDPMTAETILQTIEGVAQSNPIVARINKFIGPGVSTESLPDFSLPSIRQALVTPVEFGGIGLTQEQAGPILRSGETKQKITALEIEFVRTHLWP